MAFQKVSFAAEKSLISLNTDSGSFRTMQIRLLGGKLGEAIAAEYGVETVGDLL